LAAIWDRKYTYWQPGNAALAACPFTENMNITWIYYFRTGIIMTLPVLFVTLALALRLSFTL
jgi:hypothetical protein